MRSQRILLDDDKGRKKVAQIEDKHKSVKKKIQK